MKNFIRWVLVLPGAICGFVAAFFIALYMKGWVDSFCPPDRVMSGTCVWEPIWVDDVPIVFGSALAGCFVVLIGAFLAPARRCDVAIVLFGLGTLVAIYWTILIWPSVYPFLSSILGGGVATLWMRRKYHDTL